MKEMIKRDTASEKSEVAGLKKRKRVQELSSDEETAPGTLQYACVDVILSGQVSTVLV